jgi:hypothetical protein
MNYITAVLLTEVKIKLFMDEFNIRHNDAERKLRTASKQETLREEKKMSENID